MDVTADVDFALCRRAAERKGARVPPLLTQGAFLMRMGITDRVQQLLDSKETNDDISILLDAFSLRYWQFTSSFRSLLKY